MTFAGRVAVGIASVAVLAVVACGGRGLAAAGPALTLMPAEASVPPVPAAAAISGTNERAYDVGPFRISTAPGLALLPSQDDASDPNGEDIPQKCAEVHVTNTSHSFSGWVAATVIFVAGHRPKGRLLDTEAADPSGGSSGGASDNLAPGQSQILFACSQVALGQRVTAQLTQASYGPSGVGTAGGIPVPLKH